MDVRRLIGRLLAILIVAGLVTLPFAAPAATKQLAAVDTTDMPAMSDHMPCCPDGQKSRDCQDCPLIAICTLTVAQAEAPSPAIVRAPSASRSRLLPFDDLIAEGLLASPLDHPPRTYV